MQLIGGLVDLAVGDFDLLLQDSGFLGLAGDWVVCGKRERGNTIFSRKGAKDAKEHINTDSWRVVMWWRIRRF